MFLYLYVMTGERGIPLPTNPVVPAKVTKSNIAMMKSHLPSTYNESTKSTSIDASSSHQSHNGQHNVKNNTTNHSKAADVRSGRFKASQQLSQQDSIHEEAIEDYTTGVSNTVVTSNQTIAVATHEPEAPPPVTTIQISSQSTTVERAEELKNTSNAPNKRKMR